MEEECLRWETRLVIRVHVMVEGQTEETFVRDVLYDHLQHHGVFQERTSRHPLAQE